MNWQSLLQLLMEKWEITRWEGFSGADGVQDIHIRIERRP